MKTRWSKRKQLVCLARLEALALVAAMTVTMYPVTARAEEDVNIPIKTGGNIHDYGKSGDDPATEDDESGKVYSDDYLANVSYGESEKYSMTANQTAVSVYQYRKNSDAGNRFYHMDVARFSSDDPAATLVITVEDNSDISNAVIYPEKYYPRNSYVIDEGNHTITVQMSSELGYCILDTDGDNGSNSGDPQLAIINDPTEQNKPDISAGNVLNFKTFADTYLSEHPINDTVGNKCTEAGSVTDKATGLEWEYTEGVYKAYDDKGVAFPNKRVRLSYDVSEAFQAALEEVKKSDTLNTIYFPAGTYVWSGLQISGWDGDGGDGALNIYVDEDALLVNRLQECKEAMEPAIGIWNSSNITISGRGIFDGQGAYAQYMDSKGADQSCHQGGCMIVHSENITFNDTYVRDAKQWNWECHSGVNITYNNIKGLSPYQHSWVDGLDLTSGQNITVNGAITMGNDDCFATGHYNSSNGFGASAQTGEETEEKKNLVAAAAVYNGDRFSWDAMDSQNYRINNTLGWSTYATAIKFGHSVNWKKNEDGTTSSYTLKDYEFNNVNTLHVYGSSANGGGGGIQIRNGVNGGYPEYDKIVFNNCSLTATDGGSWVQAPNTSTANFKPEEITLNNCWFNKADTSFSFASIQTAKVADLYLDGELVRYTSQADMSVAPTVDNFIFTANGEPVIANELPVFTSPADTSKTAYVGNPLVFYVKVSDADGDEVRFGDVDLSELTGAAFDKETGEFCWTPGREHAGNTYEVTFTAYDKTYEDTNDSSELKVKISVVDAGATVDTPYAAAEDARVASWKGNKTTNYGEGLYLTTCLIPNQGLLGENFESTDTNNGTDGKISYVKFDLSQLPDLDYEKADFMVTLIGVRASTASDSIRAAVVEDNSWTEKDITWVSRPEISVTDDTVLTSKTYDTSAISVKKENELTNTYKPGSTLAMRVDITDVLKKALADYKTGGEDKKYLTLAFCNTSGSEIFFASREMAANNSNMTADMAPSIVLTTATELEIKGTDSLKLYEGYESCRTDSFALLGSGNLSASLESSTDKITWDSVKQQIAIESGLEKGTYTAKLTVTGEDGVSAEHTFTLTVVKDPENMTPEDFEEYIIAQFNFDRETDGFIGGGAKADGTYALEDSYAQKAGKALYLDGNAGNYLTVTDVDGKSLLTGVGELTISFDAKADRTSSNWVFYAAPDNNPQPSGNKERYLGILQRNGKVTVERYKNSGKRPANPSADVDGWYHMDVVVSAADTRIYVNGELAAAEASSYQLQDILGEESILMIGKANWHDGEYYKGWIDNMTIYSEALTDKVIKENAKEFLGTQIAEIRVDAPSDCITGDSLNQDNLKVTAVYKDGTEMDVTGEVLSADGAVSGFDSGTAGVKNVTVSYGGMTNTFKVNMRALSSIRVETAPAKTEYILGDEMDVSGMKVTAVYVLGDDSNPENEKEYDVTEEVLADANAVSGFASTKAGEKKLTVTYGGKTVELATVTVKDELPEETVLSELRLIHAPNKTEYRTGDALDLTGLELTGVYTYNGIELEHDLTAYVIENQEGAVSGYDPEKTGEQTITVTYQECTAEFKVTVTAKPVELTALTEKIKEAQAIEGGEYTAESYAALATAIENAQAALDTCKTAEDVTNAVTELQKAIDGLKTKEPEPEKTLTSIRVVEGPAKTSYEQGEELDLTGMKIEAVYSDQSTAEITEGYTVTGYENDKEGIQKITVTYEGKTAEFEVKVTAKPVELTALTEKIKEAQAIEEGEYTTESYAALVAAIENARAALDTCKTAEDVTNAVAELQKAIDGLKTKEPEPEKTLTSIRVVEGPAKTEYIRGEVFDPAGLVIEAVYSDESTERVTRGFETSGYDCDNIGSQTITITYRDQTATFQINVREASHRVETAIEGENGKNVVVSIPQEAVPDYVGGITLRVDKTEATSELEQMFTNIAEKIQETLVIQGIVVNADNTTVLDIRLVDDNNTEVQPKGEVSVAIPKLAGHSYNLQLFHQHGDNLEKVEYQWNDKDEMVFRTDKFSLYSIVDLGEVNKDGLRNSVAEAEKLIQDEYTPTTWTVLQDAMNTAESLLQNEKATQEQVNSAIAVLQEAMTGLVKKDEPSVVTVDKTALESVLAAAAALTETEYTPESWKALQEALNAAQTVNENSEATQEQVDLATTNLNAAIEALIKAGGAPAVVDKSVLGKKLETAKALKEAEYMAESWKAFKEVLAKAEAVYEDADVTQQQVDAAEAELDQAMKDLKKNDTKPGNAGTQTSVNNTSGGNQNTGNSNQANAAPRTGDDSPVGVLISIAFIACLAAIREMYFKAVQRRMGRH